MNTAKPGKISENIDGFILMGLDMKCLKTALQGIVI